MVWDFDQTLIPGYMQRPLFAEYDIDPSQFWAEANALPDQYGKRDVRVTPDSAYLNHMLSYTWEGKFPDLSNEKPRSYGAKLDFYDGMPEFMECIATAIAEDAKYRHHEIRVEHYIVSTGLRQIIEGSPIRDKVRDVWASEFIEQPLGLSGQMRLPVGDSRVVGGPAPTITQIGYAIDNTTKTRAVRDQQGRERGARNRCARRHAGERTACAAFEHDLHRRRPVGCADVLGREAVRRQDVRRLRSR